MFSNFGHERDSAQGCSKFQEMRTGFAKCQDFAARVFSNDRSVGCCIGGAEMAYRLKCESQRNSCYAMIHI